ncbi:MAG: ATP-binding cassette domain-containing protein [Chloroflexi bacterium]|nr:ATP-binding cassette domain-containing protein [Chloroflexota bacterium]
MAINLEDVWVGYGRRGSYTLRGIDLSVPPGGSLTIIGPSGSGKTTLLRVILGFLKPSRGKVKILGQELDEVNFRALRTRIGYIPQQLGLVNNLTVLENALLGSLSRVSTWRSLLGAFPQREIDQALSSLECVGLAEKVARRVYELSGGERQRVAIARALVQTPDILLADEFLSDLDYVRAQEILQMMKSIQRQGQTLVMVTHDLILASQWGERAIVMKDGLKVAEVSPDELNASNLRELFA